MRSNIGKSRRLLTICLGLFCVALMTACLAGNQSTNKLGLIMPLPYNEDVQGNEDEVNKGKQLYLMHCAACHQKNGQGKTGLAPSIRNKDFLALASDDFIKKSVIEGRAMTTMIPRPDLKGEKLNAIVAYLRSGYKGKVIVNDKLKFTGDAKKGRADFQTYCASCHGKRGEGYFGGGPGTGIGLKSFLDNASDDYIFQTLKRGRIGTAMRSMIGAKGVANLTERQAKDIIVYLRTLNK